MKYTFEILGVSPILEFFNHQQEILRLPPNGVEYVAAYRCTLDDLLSSVETVPRRRGWDQEDVVNSVVAFWMQNAEAIQHWRDRLCQASGENLLIARLADFKAMQRTLNNLFSL